jgi:thiol-disulfide isomerase/thioredoxin
MLNKCNNAELLNKKIKTMKKLVSMVAIFILNFACTSAQKTEFALEALNYNLKTTSNEDVLFKDVLKKYEGKTIVLEVWASWCGDCVKNMPKIKQLQSENPDLSYVFLSVDKTDKAWIKGIEKHALQGDHYLITDGMKGKFGKAIDLDWIPRYIIIDKTGKIALYRAIETDFVTINTIIKQIK